MVIRTFLILGLLASCTDAGLDDPQPLPEADENFFRCQVQPVLAQSCAFMDCHGNETRPLRIYAEQRFRLNIDWIDYETPITREELAANFTLVRGFLGRRGAPNLLAEKPLDTRSGGLFHGADGLYGPGDVFADKENAHYQALRAFGDGATAADDCVVGEEL